VVWWVLEVGVIHWEVGGEGIKYLLLIKI